MEESEGTGRERVFVVIVGRNGRDSWLQRETHWPAAAFSKMVKVDGSRWLRWWAMIEEDGQFERAVHPDVHDHLKGH